jgi:hypothetical protein
VVHSWPKRVEILFVFQWEELEISQSSSGTI